MMSALFLSLAFAQEAPSEASEEVVESAGPDRSGAPAVADPVALDLADLEVHELASGLEVHHIRIPRMRKVSVDLTWWKGSLELGKENRNAADLLNEMWGLSSEKYDPQALSQLEDKHDMVVVGSLSKSSASVTLNVPLDDLDIGLDLMADVALHPTFPKRDVKVDQDETLRWYHSEGPNSPGAVAWAALDAAWFPADHPYGWRPDPVGYASVKAKSLPALHEQIVGFGPATIVVVGDLDYSAIAPKLEARFGHLVGDGERAEPLEVKAPTQDRVIAIDIPSSEQALIRMRMAAPHRSHEDLLPLRASSWALGGHFLARFNKNLREDKGWTYGVRAGASASRTYGTFGVSVDVPADKLSAAVTELEHELTRVVDEGIETDELDAWWRGAMKGFNDTRGTLDSAEAFYQNLHYYEERVADRVEQLDGIRAVTIDEAKAAAGRWLSDDQPRVWIVAGPRDALEKGFDDLDWKVEWVTPTDAIWKRLAATP